MDIRLFKEQAKQAAEYLARSGHVVPHTLMLEAFSRAFGERNWSTMRALLAHEGGQAAHEQAAAWDAQQGPMTDTQFVAAAGLRCPVCGSKALDADNLQADGPDVYEETCCLDCNATWTTHYRVSGYSLPRSRQGVTDPFVGEHAGAATTTQSSASTVAGRALVKLAAAWEFRIEPKSDGRYCWFRNGWTTTATFSTAHEAAMAALVDGGYATVPGRLELPGGTFLPTRLSLADWQVAPVNLPGLADGTLAKFVFATSRGSFTLRIRHRGGGWFLTESALADLEGQLDAVVGPLPTYEVRLRADVVQTLVDDVRERAAEYGFAPQDWSNARELAAQSADTLGLSPTAAELDEAATRLS